jgi:uncharacterized membrane-anchored protein YjiN (DUF445 family)
MEKTVNISSTSTNSNSAEKLTKTKTDLKQDPKKKADYDKVDKVIKDGETYITTLNKTSTTKNNIKIPLNNANEKIRKSINIIVQQIYEQNYYMFSNTSFDNNIKFSIEYINSPTFLM